MDRDRKALPAKVIRSISRGMQGATLVVLLGAMWEGAKVAFAATWIAGQAALILTAGARPDAAFGFRMFPESSTLSYRLFREVDAPSGHGTVPVEVPDGDWTAKDANGTPHRLSWRARVKEPALSTFGATMNASYGAGAQVQRLEAALRDVARHIPEDDETRALDLEVTVRKNGRAPTTIRFVARR
jgi:hypothetical protein